MNKVLAILILVFLPINSLVANAASCKHSWKIEQCNSELKAYLKKDWTFVTPWASLKHVEEFVCLQDLPEVRVFQIAMEENFKVIDEEMDKYLSNLATSKDLYFWKWSWYTYFDWLTHIWEKTWYYKWKLYEMCSISMKEAWECVENMAYSLPEERPSLSVLEARQFVEWGWWDCFKLSDIKVEIFNQVAYNMMLLNKQQVSRDEKKLYDQQLRTKYDRVVDLMMINLWYLERIWKKWPEKLRNVY